jgi:hypothetical protein
MYFLLAVTTLVTAYYIVKEERLAHQEYELPVDLPLWEQFVDFREKRGKHLAAAATARFAIVVAHFFWVARIPQW